MYFNNAATTWPKPPAVAEKMRDFLTRGGANLGRGSISSRDRATLDLVSTCRERLATMLEGHEGRDPRYVTFTDNVTASLNVVFKGFLRPGMRVLTTSMEHNAVVRPLRSLEESVGIEVVILPCDPRGHLDPGDLEAALASGGDLVALSHASNVCGTIQDMDAIASVCHQRRVPLVVDVAQTAGVLPVSAERWHAAAVCFTGHKGLLGPQGIGGIVWHPEFAHRTRPLVEGGTGSFSHEERQPSVLPDKFEAGTPNLPGIAGLEGALAWIESQGREAIARREHLLGERLLKGLRAIPRATLYGMASMEGRLPVFPLNVEGWDNGTLAFELSERFDIEGRPGLHCAPWAHRTLGSFPQGALRLSPGYFTTEDEVDRCLEALAVLSREPSPV